MNVVLIYNSGSGGSYTLRNLKKLCKQHGVTVRYSFSVKQLSSRKLAQLVKQGVIVAAVGGDGTMNGVANLLVGSKSTLLPLPGGTLNHFVKDLGMPTSVEEVLAGSKRAEEKLIDVGRVNDEVFLNNASLGLYPFTLLDRERAASGVSKWVAASVASVRQLVRFKRLALIIDGKKVRSPFVFVGNNKYDIKASLVPQRTKLTKGILTVMMATSRSRWHLIRAAFAVARGSVGHRDDFSLSYQKELAIYSRHTKLPVSFDGEVAYLPLPLIFKTEPGALKILHVKDGS